MNASNYPPLNVLCAVKSRESDKLRYKITPYRFMKQNGEAFRIKEIRHFHQSRKGRGEHYHYIVDVGEHRYCRILFDTNSFTWRLIQDIKMGETDAFKEIEKKCKGLQFLAHNYRERTKTKQRCHGRGKNH